MLSKVLENTRLPELFLEDGRDLRGDSFHDAASALLTVTKLPSMKTPTTPSSSKSRLAKGESAAASFDEKDLLPSSITLTLSVNFMALGLGVG